MIVQCSAHVDPELGFMRSDYTEPHSLTEGQAIILLGHMSRGWSEEPSCLLDALLGIE